MAEYSKLPENDHSDRSDSASSSGESDFPSEKVAYLRPKKRASPLCIAFFWITSLLASAAVTAIAMSNGDDAFGSLARGYTTDFGPAHKALSLKKVKFAGSPKFGEDGEEYIPEGSPSLEYIGSGPSVDAAWKKLEDDRYFLLTDEEAEQAWGSNYQDYWHDRAGGYLGGLDMFHTLHCLDHLRKSFYPDVYKLDGIHGDMHQLHCIDHLRQMIQCNSDLTIIPTRWFEGIGQNYIDSDQTHTCRDFSQVRKWASSRYNGTEAVPSRHRDGSLWADNEWWQHEG